MIVSGRAPIEPPLTDDDLMQLRLRYRIAAEAAEMYCAAGFTVVYQDIIIGEVLREVVEMLKGKRPLALIVLCPSPDVVGEREGGAVRSATSAGRPPI
jgi:hypothetical protein